MNARSIALLLAVLALGSGTISARRLPHVDPKNWPIKHFLVLMEENRSFDHMLGAMKALNPGVNGLNGDECNPFNTSDPQSQKLYVSPTAAFVDPDPDHSVPGTTEQVFGEPNSYLDPPPMNGFVQSYHRHYPGQEAHVMTYFNTTHLPIMTTLAQEFLIMDQYFPSIPGPTEVNRMYAHSGTSHGYADTTDAELIEGFPQPTIYESLEAANVSWRIYFEEIPSALMMKRLRKVEYLRNFRTMEQFFQDLKTGDLPTYAWMDPRYYSLFNMPANDQHPAHAVNEGERLMKTIYEALRASPAWNDSLLMITYDEHGGFYDHFPTPLHDIPNPDGLVSLKPAFNFTRLGVRIPVLMISPWVAKGGVMHGPTGPLPSSQFDHSSIPAFLKKWQNLDDFLTKRDAWAGTFEDVFLSLQTPRTDCPETLPAVPPPDEQFLLQQTMQPLSHLQQTWIGLARGLSNDGSGVHEQLQTEMEGGLYVREQVNKYFQSMGVPLQGSNLQLSAAAVLRD